MSSGGSGAGSGKRWPVGILAALLASAILVVGLFAVQAYALRLAERHLASVASPPLPIKYETLTFQRAAFAVSGELPIYGSSELFCCGQPDLPTEFFANAPTGFKPFAVGRAGTGDLMFLEEFGALGNALRGHRVVVSVSPEWFYGKAGITAGYNGNFSPEVASVFIYDAPLPLALREAAAQQMLAHPSTLKGQSLLNLGVRALASGDLPLDYALLPVGRLDAWAQQVKDAWQTIAYIDGPGRAGGPAGAGGPGGSSAGGKVVRIASAQPASSQVRVATEGIGVGAASTVIGALRGLIDRIGNALLSEAATAGAPGGSAPAAAPASATPASGPRSVPPSALGSGSKVVASGAASPSGAGPVSGSAFGSASGPVSGSASPSPSGSPGGVSRAPSSTPAAAGAGRVTRLAIQPVGAPLSARPLLASLTRQAGAPPAGAPINWRAKLVAATRLENTLAGSDPFGFWMNGPSLRLLEPALRLYCAGTSNAAGGVYPFPGKWASTMRGSAEWTALGLELQALHDLGANALVWTIPFQGYYDNYTQLSRAARQVYYNRFLQVAAPSGLPAVTFEQAGQDRLFIANVGNHFSARGWVVADQVLNLFWHGQTAAIPGTIAAMTHQVPSPPPVRPLACPGPNTGGVTHAGTGAAG